MKNIGTLLFALVCAFAALSVRAQQNYAVQLAGGPVFLPENLDALRQNPAVDPEEIVDGFYVRYLQCDQIPTAAERSRLESAGLQFWSYVSYAAYLVAIPEGFDLARLAPLKPRSLAPVQAEWKMARSLREPPFGDWAIHGDQIDVNVQVYPLFSCEQGANLCRQQGLLTLEVGNQNGYLRLRVPQERLREIAALPFIQYLEQIPRPSEPDDRRGRALHRANLLDSNHALGYHYDGSGVKVLVRDDGPIGPHIDFQGRLYNFSSKAGLADGTHGDRVSGCVGGAGNLDPNKRGMAPGADVYAVDYEESFQDQTLSLCQTEGIPITNTSYSQDCNLGYTISAQTVDLQLFENQALSHVFSSGNRGASNCGYGAGANWGNITGGHKMAKNAVVVGNLNSAGDLEASSSRGPAYDGRLKPDISAHGTDVDMPLPNNQYETATGTSFSAPNVAGCMAQLTQAYKTLHNGEWPNATLLKAAILNTANDLGNTGPDFKFGWGHINTFRALRLLENGFFHSAEVDQNDSRTYAVQIPAGVRQARLMICWNEVPSAEFAAKALINDLDLSVKGPDGSVFLPWKLNPTPNTTTLNQAAGKGRDSLNNVEQVAINDPVAGTYTVVVNGYEVPMGPQPYYLVWEFLTDEVKLTYPAGGEALPGGQSDRIHWDAFGNTGEFLLQYSTDNGLNWLQIAPVNGVQRSFEWSVPPIVTDQMKVRVTRNGQSDTSAFPIHVAPVPSNLQVEQVCPDFIRFSWNALSDTLAYDVYLLGKKYMEIVGSTDTTRYTIPIQNALEEKWLSVRAKGAGTLAGPRALAIRWPGNLKNCTQALDLGVRRVIQPFGNAIVVCGPENRTLKVLVRNEGLGPTTSAPIFYQVNNEPVVSETLPALAPGDSIDFAFQKSFAISGNGQIDLKVWCALAGDGFLANDTLRLSFPVFSQPEDNYFNENFQNGLFPPPGWLIENPDNYYTWEQIGNITGPNGNTTRAIYVDCYDYDATGAEDYIYLQPVDLSKLDKPALVFDLAHAMFSGGSSETLRIELFADCDLAQTPAVIWQKTDPELATAAAVNGKYFPSNIKEWRKELVDLQDFADKTVVIRFVAVNGWGNSVFLDDIGIAPLDNTPAMALINTSEDSICRGDTIVFQAAPSGPFAKYYWTFGTAAQPSSANGIGPHKIKYPVVGNKFVRLIVASPTSSDTTVQVVTVQGLPSANFVANANNLTVTFANSSSNGVSYLWDFGDGQTSTENNPSHTYSQPGVYEVTLSTTNLCQTAVKTAPVVVAVTGTNTLMKDLELRILPNPSQGDFRVEINYPGLAETVRLSLLDAQGRLVKTLETTLKQGRSSVFFESLHLPEGIYQLQLQTTGGLRTFKVALF